MRQTTPSGYPDLRLVSDDDLLAEIGSRRGGRYVFVWEERREYGQTFYCLRTGFDDTLAVVGILRRTLSKIE